MRLSDKNRVRVEKICRYLGYLNPLIHKSKKKIFIYNSTPSYQNNYSMYNYLIKNGYNERYKIYYYMPEVKKNTKKADNVVFGDDLLGSLFHYLTAKYVFFDTGNIRIRPSKKQIVMNLWHGVPFKSIGFMSNAVEKNLPKDLMNTFTKIIVPNKSMKEVYLKSFLLNENQVYYGGQPRNDLLKMKGDPFKLLNIETSKYKKIIMWMTTYRISKDERLCHTSDENWSDTGLPLLVDQEKLIKINKELAQLNILLLIKQHTTGKSPKNPITQTENIKILEEEDYLSKGLQLYEVLGKCDGLITDYSSVFIDYLLVNRPIAFVVNDIEDYKNSNGFNFENPLEYMPGMHLTKLEDLKNYLIDISIGNDEHFNKRKQVSSYFNEYHRTDNCRYILESMRIK